MSVTTSGLHVSSDGILQGTADEYLFRLFCDKVILNVKGLSSLESAVRLSRLSDSAKHGDVNHQIIGGESFRVKRGKGLFKLLLTSPQLDVTVYAAPLRSFGPDWPVLRFQFDARACRTTSFSRMRAIAQDVSEMLDVRPHAIELAEVHVCCDVPSHWTDVVRGERKGRINCGRRPKQDPLSFHDNGVLFKRRKGARVSWTIYDLRHRTTRIPQWRESWLNLGIDPSSSLTRIEVRFLRRHFQQDRRGSVDDLTPDYLQDQFTWFATRYLRMEDGEGVTDIWEQVSRATCSTLLTEQAEGMFSRAA